MKIVNSETGLLLIAWADGTPEELALRHTIARYPFVIPGLPGRWIGAYEENGSRVNDDLHVRPYVTLAEDASAAVGATAKQRVAIDRIHEPMVLVSTRSPRELARALAVCLAGATENEAFFASLNQGLGGNNRAARGNAKYLALQASEYLNAMTSAIGAGNDNKAELAFAMSDLARVLAIAMRECIAQGWDFIGLLVDGMEYESAVVADIQEGRREGASHRGFGE